MSVEYNTLVCMLKALQLFIEVEVNKIVSAYLYHMKI